MTPDSNSAGNPSSSPDPAKAAKLAQQIVGLLTNEDAATRKRAMQAAAMLLGDEVAPTSSASGKPLGSGEVSDVDLASFFNRDGEMKPSDYAFLCAAYHFSQYGSASFSMQEMRTIAAEAGVVVPDRLDKTFAGATKKGKKLFQGTGRGIFKPTAAGGLEFGERWGVKPGRQTKPSASTD